MIGELLAEVRKDHHETQEDLAVYLHVSISTIRSWERESSSPNHDFLVKICRHYDVSSDYLLGLTRVDPMDMQRQQGQLTKEELEEVHAYGEYLLWKRNEQAKK